jgi:maltoporin
LVRQQLGMEWRFRMGNEQLVWKQLGLERWFWLGKQHWFRME